MTTEASRPYALSKLSAGLVAGAFIACSLAWMFLVGLGAMAFVLAVASWNGAGPEVLERPPAMTTGVMAAATISQFVGMWAIANALMRWTRYGSSDSEAQPGPHTRRDIWAWRAPEPRVSLGIGAVSGLILGFLPAKIAEWVAVAEPTLDHGGLARIATALNEGSGAERALFAVAVCVIAPIVEELTFRGFLFDTLARAVGGFGAWALTTVLFAAYHLDPVHAAAVLFTGACLGGLRAASGSTWPPILAHLGNNLMAAFFAVTATDGTAQVPTWAALLSGAAVTLLVVGLVGSSRRTSTAKTGGEAGGARRSGVNAAAAP